MIIDHREISFEAEALLAVLGGSPRAVAAFGLPPGMPQAVLFEPGQQAVRFVYSQGGRSRSAALATDRLGALLVGFSLRLRIPLPRRAEKSIRVEPDKVVLAFRTRVKPDFTALLAEGRLPEGEAPAQRAWAEA